MQYSALILTTEELPIERTVIYETYNRNSFVIVKEKYMEEVWTVDDHIILPKAVLDFMEIFRMEQRNGGTSHEGYLHTWSRTVIHDRFDLDSVTRKLLHQYDCSDVPIYPNQSQTFEELHSIDDYWKQVNSPTSPVVSQMEDTTVLASPFNDLTKPVPETPKQENDDDDALLETPPVTDCCAPRKRRRLEQSKDAEPQVQDHTYAMEPLDNSCTPKKLHISEY